MMPNNFRQAVKLLSLLFLFSVLSVWADDTDSLQPQSFRTDIDVSVPRIRLRPLVSGPMFSIYDKLPSKLYFSANTETSLRMETNPYQAPQGAREFIEVTNAFRVQSDATVGYALSKRFRVSANYFFLKDQFNDFTPFHLDSTIHSLSGQMEYDLLQKNGWLVRTSLQARQLFLPKRRESGDVIPSFTVSKNLGMNGWAFANASLDLNRKGFSIGDVDSMTQLYTVGTGYQVPYESKGKWLKWVEGTQLSLSTTYSLAAEMKETPFRAPNAQSIIVTAEVSRPLKRGFPVMAFLRAEPVFGFGTPNDDSFGQSGVNFRLFGGIRASLAKNVVEPISLDPAPAQENAADAAATKDTKAEAILPVTTQGLTNPVRTGDLP
jgi:hypothetical protein